MKIPIGRTTRLSYYSPGGESPRTLGPTWLESESFAYPHGGFTRRAYVELQRNPNNAISLPYGEQRMVYCSIPDTFFSIPARLRYRGHTIAGFIAVTEPGMEAARFTFTPQGLTTQPDPC